MEIRPLCFLRQYNDKLDIYVNAYKRGFKILKWKKSGTTLVKTIDLTSPYITIDGLNDYGKYKFTLYNNLDEKSYTYSIMILSEDKMYTIEKVKNYITQPADANYINETVTNLRKEIARGDASFPLDGLYKLYNSILNIEDLERKSYCQLFNAFEIYENTQNSIMNAANLSYSYIEHGAVPYLITGGDVNKLLIYKITDYEDELISVISGLENNHRMPLYLENNALYKFELYADTDLLIKLMHYQPDETGTEYMWNNNNNDNELVDIDYIQDDTQLSHIGVQLTTNDKDRYILEKTKENDNYISPRPLVELKYPGSTSVVVTIPEFKLLNATERQYTLAVREPDMLLNFGYDRCFAISNPTIEINLLRAGVDGEAFFFIQDDCGQPVSRLTCFKLYDDSIDSYEENKRLIELNNYISSILREVNISAPEFYTNIQQDLIFILQNESVNIDNMYKSLICRIAAKHEYKDKKNKIIPLIISNWLKQFKFDKLFFPNGYAEYTWSLDTFDFQPMDQHYALVVEHFQRGDTLPTTDYYASYNAAIRIETREYDYCWMYAIDQKTYKRSGYIYLDSTTKPEATRFNNNINIEEIR